MEDGVSGAITLFVQPHVEVDTNIRLELVPTQLHLTEETIVMEVKKKLWHATLNTVKVELYYYNLKCNTFLVKSMQFYFRVNNGKLKSLRLTFLINQF